METAVVGGMSGRLILVGAAGCTIAGGGAAVLRVDLLFIVACFCENLWRVSSNQTNLSK